MVGLTKTDDCMVPRSDMNDAGSIQTGRVSKSKKRGLSRHYPHKAQSFDCIADLLNDSDFGESTVVLSKTISVRSMPPAGKGLVALRRVNTTAALSEESTISEDSVANTWAVLDEQSLCSAFEGARLQEENDDQDTSPAEVDMCSD